MAKVTGVVTKHDKNKYGGWSIVVDGNYYNSKFEIKCSVGDSVEFDDGGKNYCSKLKVLTKAAPTTAQGSSGGTAPASHRDVSIVRQNALRHAGVIMSAILHDEVIPSDDEIVDRTIAMAKAFEAYVNDVPTTSSVTTDKDFIEAA